MNMKQRHLLLSIHGTMKMSTAIKLANAASAFGNSDMDMFIRRTAKDIEGRRILNHAIHTVIGICGYNEVVYREAHGQQFRENVTKYITRSQCLAAFFSNNAHYFRGNLTPERSLEYNSMKHKWEALRDAINSMRYIYSNKVYINPVEGGNDTPRSRRLAQENYVREAALKGVTVEL